MSEWVAYSTSPGPYPQLVECGGSTLASQMVHDLEQTWAGVSRSECSIACALPNFTAFGDLRNSRPATAGRSLYL
jgi:hypothetical protein